MFALLLVVPAAAETYIPKIESHYRRVIKQGRDVYGARKTPLWLASMDVRKGGQFEPAPEASRRTYRTIHAPRGSTIYWDQPLIGLGFWLSGHTGNETYAEAAEAYVREHLDCCIDSHTSMFQWGNHLYYDVFTDGVVQINNTSHEIRPIAPAWSLFWRIAPEITERAIRAAVRGHVRDAGTGLFNRHARTGPPSVTATDESVMPFLAAGSSLVESLTWLAQQGAHDARELEHQALTIARYSFSKRDRKTGLVPTQPAVQRWDSKVATTETGLWAGGLLRAWRLSGQDELREMAREAVTAYLRAGWDAGANRYYGQLRLSDGKPDSARSTEWQPSFHSDVWEPLFPSHDYPMPFAEACLTLWQVERDERFAECARRWIVQLRSQMPPRYPRASITDSEFQPGTYAEFYGRAIHFLVRAAKVLDTPPARELAETIAGDAIDKLWVSDAGLFRSHPGEDRTGAVDGLGYLFAALVYLETGEEPDVGGIAGIP